MHLSDLKLRSLPFGDGQRDYPDDTVRGLCLRVGKRTKTFMLTIGKPRRRVTLGHYPDLSVSKAREKARDLLAEARIKKDEPAAHTFDAALGQFLKLHVPTMRRLTQRECTRILSTRFPSLSKRRLTDLKTSELATILDAIGAPAERRNAFVWLRTFLNWCYRRGYLDQNPISRLRPPVGSKTRDRVLSNEEFVKVWNASYSAVSSDYGAFVRLLILTGQRKGQWEQFRPEFLEPDKIVFPADIMKGAKPHAIPLTPTAHRMIGNHSFKGWNADHRKQKLDKGSGVTGWTLHDLRRTFATKLAELGTAPHVIERILAHQTGTIAGVARIYNRASYLPEMKSALLAFEEKLKALLSETEGTNARHLSGLHNSRTGTAA